MEEILPVHIVQKAILALVATAHAVIRGAGVLEAQVTWHDATVPSSTVVCHNSNGKDRGLTPFSFQRRLKVSSVQEQTREPDEKPRKHLRQPESSFEKPPRADGQKP